MDQDVTVLPDMVPQFRKLRAATEISSGILSFLCKIALIPPCIMVSSPNNIQVGGSHLSSPSSSNVFSAASSSLPALRKQKKLCGIFCPSRLVIKRISFSRMF